MKVVNFTEEKAKKKGEVTVKSIIDELSERHSNNEIKSVVCVVLSEKDEVILSCTDMMQTKGIGLLECGKQSILNDMYG